MRQIARQHGGEARCDGSCFVVTPLRIFTRRINGAYRAAADWPKMKNDMPELEFLLDDERAERHDSLPIILLALSLGLALIWLFTPA